LAQAAQAVPQQQAVLLVSEAPARLEAPQKRSPKTRAVEVAQPPVRVVVVELPDAAVLPPVPAEQEAWPVFQPGERSPPDAQAKPGRKSVQPQEASA
jgi:hypothetical protein